MIEEFAILVRGQGQIYLKFVLFLITLTPLSFFKGVCSYIAQRQI